MKQNSGLTSEITHSEGILEINPLAMDDVTVDGVVRRQNIVFPTYKFKVKQSIAAYAEGGPNYDDIIKPIQDQLGALDLVVASILTTLNDTPDGVLQKLIDIQVEIQSLISKTNSLQTSDIEDLDLILSNLQIQLDNLHLIPRPSR